MKVGDKFLLKFAHTFQYGTWSNYETEWTLYEVVSFWEGKFKFKNLQEPKEMYIFDEKDVDTGYLKIMEIDMIFRLSTQNNKELATVEVGLQNLIKKEPFVEIRSIINIDNYSERLMDIEDKEEIALFITTFGDIASIRNWMWDEHFAMKRNTENELENVAKHVKNMLMGASVHFNLKIDKP